MNDVLLLTALGGIVALDGTSVGQLMLSRPLVAGAMAGWVVGAPLEGLLVGAALEIYLLVSFPVGGSRFPEGGPATVVAAAVAAASDHPGGVAVGVSLGLIWGQLGAFSVTAMRMLNSRLSPDPARRVTAGTVVGAHLGAVVLDFLRGSLLTVTGLWVGWGALRVVSLWPLDGADTIGFLLVGGAVSMGILLRSFGGLRRRGVLFATGLGAGALVGALL